MKIRLRFFLFVFILPLYSTAQKDFSAGTMVLNSGDTVKGMIKNIEGRINPRTIQFQASASSEIKTYSPETVKWFRFKGGEWYFGYIGAIETSSLNNNELTYDSSMHTAIDTLFINAVLISRASLYYARDRNDRIHLFYSKGTDNIVELGYKKYYVDEIVLADYRNRITKRAIISNEMYKGQLMQAFSDCRYLAIGILSRPLNYAKTDLRKLFEDYNRCKEAKVVYKETKDNGKLEVSLHAGINSTGVKLNSTLNPAWNQVLFDRSIGYEFGIGFNFLLPQLEEKWSLYNEVGIKEHHLTGADATTSPVTKYTLEALYLKVITMGEYQLPYGKVKPVFGIGLSNNLSLGYKTSGEPVTGASIFGAYRNYEHGLVFNFGLRWRDFDGTLRMEKSNGWSDYSDLHTAFTTWYFQLGYTF